MSGPGHNGGPALDEGLSWRRHAWTRARAALLPTLPLEVVRLRVARAAELGLEYRTYAGIRASTGRDLIGFLFSSNALSLLREGAALPADRAQKLAGLKGAERLALAQAPVSLGTLDLPGLIDGAFAAPAPLSPWGAQRDLLRQALRARGLPADGVLLVGAAPWEAGWSEAARLAGHLPAERFFAA